MCEILCSLDGFCPEKQGCTLAQEMALLKVPIVKLTPGLWIHTVEGENQIQHVVLSPFHEGNDVSAHACVHTHECKALENITPWETE